MRKIAKFGMTKELMTFGIGMIVLVIALAYGLDITQDVADDMDNTTAAWNATQDGIEGVGNITSQLPTIATIAMAVVIIGLVVGMMYIRRGN